MSLDNNNQTQRIAELEQQLAELRHSLEVCAAADKSSPVQVAAQQYEMPSTSLLSKDTLGSREKPARTVVSRRVEDLVVNREITSYNWGNRSAQRRLTDDELDKKPVIGICLASTSKSKRNRGSGFDAIPLFKVLLPSLANTVEPGFEYRVYVGVDSGDSFYDNDKNEKEILQWFDKHVATKATILGAHVSLKVILFVNKDHKPGPAFNKACKAAYDEGADYMYRVNDDSEFRTTFAKPYIAELENRCPPNVGVTGPTCHEGNTHILTHDFTHRHHMEIFKGQYYPVELTDWWLDDWITHIYGVTHTSRVLDVVVKHHIDAAGTRYSVNRGAKDKLDSLQKSANNAIREYIAEKFPGNDCDVLGPVSKELRVSAKPEFFTAIPGVRGIVIDPEGEDNAHHARHIANQRECSHTCQTSKLCVGYTWIGKDTESILGALKAILSIGMDEDDTAGGGSCYLFDAAQAKKLHAVQYHQHGQSGIKKKHLSDFSPRLQSLLSHVDPMDSEQFSSSAIKVSFGGGSVPGWEIDSGTVSQAAKNPVTAGASEGSFGWNCNLADDIRQRKTTEGSDLFNNIQILSRHDKCKSPRWVLQIPNGIYRVVVGYSDPVEQVVAENCKLNGAPANDGSEVTGQSFEFQSFQQIQNGQLVFSGKYAKRCTSIAYIVVDEATHYFG
eukprot:INCI802.1.p1 GENE.INCI802.1~~INCI802.1.p1  ORF type:complete len:751 (+),score=130.50 INCI802.1:241-2253(+)